MKKARKKVRDGSWLGHAAVPAPVRRLTRTEDTGVNGRPMPKVAITGWPGLSENLISVPRQNDFRSAHNPLGAPGLYDITFTLAIPGHIPLAGSETWFSDISGGDSNVVLARPIRERNPGELGTGVIGVSLNHRLLSYLLCPNDAGRLAHIKVEKFQGVNFADAVYWTQSGILPVLSRISVQLSIPLQIHVVEAEELSSGTKRYTYTVPHPNVLLLGIKGSGAISTNKFSPAMQIYAGLYREALNTNSVSYSFLCLYKIIDGIRASRRKLLRKVSESSSHEPTNEKLPDSRPELEPWLDTLLLRPKDWGDETFRALVPHAEWLGRSFSWIIDRVLSPIRVQVAHVLTEQDDTPLNVDNYLHQQAIYVVVPIATAICRQMLRNDFPDELL